MKDQSLYSTLMIVLGAMWIFFGVPEIYRDYMRQRREQQRSKRATKIVR